MEMAPPCSQILDNSLGLWEKARERDCDLWEKERMFGGWDKANSSCPAQLLHGFIRVWEFVYNLREILFAPHGFLYTPH